MNNKEADKIFTNPGHDLHHQYHFCNLDSGIPIAACKLCGEMPALVRMYDHAERGSQYLYWFDCSCDLNPKTDRFRQVNSAIKQWNKYMTRKW